MKTAYSEALRYIENAKETLKKAGKKDGEYADIKYVQTASGTAYKGVLIALDEYLKRKEGTKYKKPKSIEEYRTRIAKQNKTLLALTNEVYDDLHLAGYYMGTPSVKTIQNGLTVALKIIEYIKE
jgi:hypothetical protein